MNALLDARLELINGKVARTRTLLPRHAHVQGAVGNFIGGPFQDDAGLLALTPWWIFGAVDIALGPHDIVRPDLAGWRKERLPRPGAARPIEVAPDWVCEIAKPTSCPQRTTESPLPRSERRLVIFSCPNARLAGPTR